MNRKPEPPREPAPEECCGKGCTPCVLDVYAEALARYRAALETWKSENLKKRAGSTRRCK